MYKSYLAFCLIIIGFLSCSKENEKSETEAIKAIRAGNESCVCDPYIDQYLWNGKTVYYLGYRGACL